MENKSLVNDAISQFFQDTEKVTQTLQTGIRAALLQHKQAGNSICAWRNGKIIWIEPNNIPLGKENTQKNNVVDSNRSNK